MKPQQVDILISGGGLIGLTLAIGLQRLTNYSIGIIEPKTFIAHSSPYSGRSIGLSSGGWHILQRLRIADELQVNPIKRVEITRQHQWGRATIDAKEEGVESLGVVLETNQFAQQLYEQCFSSTHQEKLKTNGVVIEENVTSFSGYSINKIEFSPQTAQVSLQALDQSTLTVDAKLLIIAEGAESPTRNLLKIAAQKHSYQAAALTGQCIITHPTAAALERFTDQGPLALLPLETPTRSDQPTRYALVWVGLPETLNAFQKLSAKKQCRMLEEQWGYRFAVHEILPLTQYPLQRVIAEETIRPRVLLLGNAARSLHPVAAQGYNLALRDVDTLISELLSHHELAHTENDPGNYEMLSRIQQQRKTDQQRVVQFIDTLLTGFSNAESGLPKSLSAFAAPSLTLFDIVSPLKRGVARFAMGGGYA